MRLRESGEVLEGLREFKQHVQQQLSNQNSTLQQSQTNLFANFDHINALITTHAAQISTLQHQLETITAQTNQLEQSNTQK